MANHKTPKAQPAAAQVDEKVSDHALTVGNLVQVTTAPDGTIVVKEALSTLKLVDIADVDLLLTFANGDHVVIPNGALDALSPNPLEAIFNDRHISLSDLFKLVGVANPSKAGSLRLVSENIDANPPPEASETQSEHQPDTPPPAPMVKIGVGTSAGVGKGPGKGPGNGGGEGDVPATVTFPAVTATPSYSRGKPTQTVSDILSGAGNPNSHADLYTSSSYKADPSGRADLPLGAYDPNGTADQLAARYSPAGQATREVIHGTGAADAINFNPAFSAGEGQWSKTLHVTFNNYSAIDSIQLIFNATAIAQIPGFNLQGAGVTRDGPTLNSWHITPTTDMLVNGADIQIVYDINDSHAPIDFGADLVVNGHAGLVLVPTDYINLAFTWRDALTATDFNVPDDNNNPRLVLPRSGVGVEVFAGNGDDVIHVGAGADLIHGEDGNDTIYAGTANDILDGGIGDDTLYGEAGNDTFIGGAGVDAMDGGVGVDVVTYEASTLGVVASLDLALGVSTTNDAAGDTFVKIENLTGSQWDDTLIGDGQANVLTGGAGDDKLIGGLNADTLNGGLGNDTASYAFATSAVTVSLASNTGTQGEADGDTLISIENLIGGSGNDTFISGLGVQANQYDGHGGFDTVSYEASASSVVAILDSGLLLTPISATNNAAGDVYVSIENLTGTAFNDTLIGDGAANVLTAGAGNDTLEGLSSGDTFNGGTGTNTVTYANSVFGVTSSLTTTFSAGPIVTQTNDAAGDTYNSIQNLTGSALADTLIGDSLVNRLDGGTGDDTLEGMASGDSLVGGDGNDTASYEHASAYVVASLTGGLVISQGDAAGDSFDHIENLTGTAFNDTLIGDDYVNILTGGAGDDSLEGLNGADSFIGDTGLDTVSYANSALGVVSSLTLSSAFTVGAAVTQTNDAAGDTYDTIENLAGSRSADTLIGDAQDNQLDGKDGNDILEGMGGADSLIGGNGTDTATYEHSTTAVVASMTLALAGIVNSGDAAGDTYNSIENLTGTDFNDTLIGNNVANVIFGGADDDILEGLGGSDTLNGGAGNNTASYEHAADLGGGAGVVASLSTFVAPTVSTGDALGDVYVNIKNLVGSAFNDTLIGDNQANVLTGGTGDDKLVGRGGADTLEGGLGSDTASYEYATSAVSVSLATNTGTQGEATDDVLNSIENLIGGSGNDTFISALGVQANAYDGRAGIDTVSYVASWAGVVAVLDPTQVSLVSQTNDAAGDTFTKIENLIGTGFDDTLIGTNSVNTLDGGVGNDTLEGLGGGDSFIGDVAGSDTVSYEHSALGVVSSLTLASALTVGPVVTQSNDAAGDTYSSIENMTGSQQADTLIGDAQANNINGGNGDDILEGLGGADTLIGGNGIDTASYVHAANAVVASLTDGLVGVTATGDAAGDTFLGIENLTGSNADDTLIGDGVANVITGGTGNDALEGLGGADTLDGGLGTDTASYAHAISYVNASLTTGLAGFTALGDAAGDTYISIENLSGTDSSDTLIGNSAANVISGGIGDDVLEGLGGADTLNGGTGINTASYEHGANQGAGLGVTASLLTPASNTGDALNDTYTNIQNLLGSAFNDILTGDANNNTLTGGDGNDTLTGGLGVDFLYGGNGNDNLFDDGIGAGILDGGVGDDIITLTGQDGTLDNIAGGTGIDTLVWASTTQIGRVDFNLFTGTVTYQFSGFGIKTNFTGIENVSVTGANNTYSYANNEDNIITGGSGVSDYVDYSYAVGGVQANLLTGVVTGGSGNDTLINIEHLYAVSLYNDVLIGNNSDNWIRGLSGNDVIDGGNGVDTWYIDYTGARVTASLMSAAQNTAMGIVMTGDASGDTISNMENIYSSYSDFLYGNAVANDLYGAGMLEGFLGGDNLRAQSTTTSYASYANAGNSYLAGQGITSAAGVGVIASLTTGLVTTTGDAAGDTYDSGIRNMMGSAFNDTLIGQANNNILNGGAGDDVLEGMDGADALIGGAGIDTASYAHANAGVIAAINGVLVGTNQALGDTFSSIENVTGSNFNDFLYGNSQDNIMVGGLGDDYLDGGSGNDTASYATATGSVNINMATNTVSGAAGNDTLVSIEKVIGSSFVDTITGTAGNDVIDGGAGSIADIIDGGAGSDTISYASALGPRSVILGDSNTDNDVLTSIENILGSQYGDTLTGDAGDNVIEGGLSGTALQIDTLSGGTNTAVGDTVSYENASSGVVVSLAIAIAQNTGVTGLDILSGFENLLGSAFDDTLTGDAGNNVIDGGSGNDILMGNAGADTLIGGLGIDTASYATSATAVNVTVNDAASGGDAAGDTLTGIENLIGSAGADTLTGDGGANTFDGGLGNDTINGLAGTDTVTYASAISAVSVDLGVLSNNVTGGAGTDTLSNIENIIGTNSSDTIIGDGNNNVFEGGLGADTMNGGGGIDTLTYANSNAGINMSLVVGAVNTGGDAAGDFLTGFGFSNIIGSAFGDTLKGNTADNSLSGGVGNDILIGGAGSDTLDGGLGLDTASYETSTVGVTVNLTSSTYRGLNQGAVYSGYGGAGDALGDTYSSIENVTGSGFNDALLGTTGNNVIDGGAGNDRMWGDGGNDIIYANQGNDVVFGEVGNDTIYVSVSSVAPASLYDGGSNEVSANVDGRDTIIMQGLTNGGYTFATLANVTDNMEGLNINGDGASTELTITSLDVRNYADAGKVSNIWITADAGDTINLTGVAAAGETYQNVAVAGGTDYLIFNAANTQVAAIHWQTA